MNKKDYIEITQVWTTDEQKFTATDLVALLTPDKVLYLKDGYLVQKTLLDKKVFKKLYE